METQFQIITFYEFRRYTPDQLISLRDRLRNAMNVSAIKGTIIVAQEGFNATVCGETSNIQRFVPEAQDILGSQLTYRSSFHADCPFRKIDVKIKPEIVTLKKPVDMSKGEGTHVNARDWNELISDPSVIVLDTRNDYEYKNGTFKRALNPRTSKFSDLPAFIEDNLDPDQHPRIAMFCTGGIRCEKFAPFMKQMGFREVFQLDGGILRYLEETPADESLWEGECFVFDERVTIDEDLRKGVGPDYSQTDTDE